VSRAGPAATAPARVLVVEDFDQLREMLVEGLAAAGLAADGAGSVPEALALRAADYDVLVVDRRLGPALGTDLLWALCDQDPTVASRFILMTAGGTAAELPAGVPVLLKPFRIDVLVDAVHRLHAAAGTHSPRR
jgi:DNA-binding response OmpR family regulator